MRQVSLLSLPLALSLALAAPAHAQAVWVGVSAGPVQSWQIGRCCGPNEPQGGLAAGITASADITRRVSLELAALLSPRGFHRGPDSWMRQSYIEFPMLARLTLPSSRTWSPTFALGVAPALEQSCYGRTQVFAPGDYGLGPVVALNCDDERNFRGDLGIVAAIGVVARESRSEWSAELRFTQGIENLAQGWSDGVYPRSNIRNRTLGLVIGARRRVR